MALFGEPKFPSIDVPGSGEVDGGVASNAATTCVIDLRK